MPETQPRPAPACDLCGLPQDPWPGGSGGYGNNAWPLSNGRCCNSCNVLRVIPARIAMLTKADETH